jgi:hypothetical protein
MTDIFTLGLKADTTDIDRGAKSLDKFADSADGADKSTLDLRKGVNDTAKAIAAFGVTTVVALGGITVAAANTAREITNLATLSNLTTEEFQRAAFAARAYGIEQDKLSDILKDTQDKVGDFLTTGGGPMIDFFETVAPLVGVTADEFRGLNGKDALQLYVTSLEKANLSQAEMVFFLEAIASDASLLQPLLANNGAEFERLANRASELGTVLDDLDIKNLLEMKTAMSELTSISAGLSNVIGATLAPFVSDLTTKFNENAIEGQNVRDMMTELVGVGVAVAGVYANAARTFEIFGESLAVVAVATENSITFIGAQLDILSLKAKEASGEIGLAIAEGFNEGWILAIEGLEQFANATSPLVWLGIIDKWEFPTPEIDTAGFTASTDEVKEELLALEKIAAEAFDPLSDAFDDIKKSLMEPLPSNAFDEWFDSINKIIKQQRELQKEVAKTGKTADDTTGKTSKGEIDATFKKRNAELSSFKEIAQGASLLFDEQSKGREALAKADEAFTAIQMALSFQKASANALEAVSSAFAAPFPINFAAGAAMIGIMSGLGLFSGSGGGGGGPSVASADELQKTQGTGTVFGSDDQSQSILRSQERFEDISIDQLSELRSIRQSMSDLTSVMEQVTKTIIGGPGIGEFAGSRKVHDEGISFVSQSLGDVIDQGIVEAESFFTVRKGGKLRLRIQDLDDSIQREMSGIFEQIGNTINVGIDTLGLDTTKALESFIIDIGRVSFEGMSGEEIQNELNAIFSTQADLITEFLVPSLEEYQQIGEGLFDTLTRVTQEQAVFNDSIDKMGRSLSDLSSIIQIDIAQSIIELTGGAERFADLTSVFFEEFFTEEEKFEHLSGSLNDAVGDLGLSMFETREQFRAMVEGVDLTTESGQMLFASLLELAPAMDDFFDVLESGSEEIVIAENRITEARSETLRLLAEESKLIKSTQRDLGSELKTTLKGISTDFNEQRKAVSDLERERISMMNGQLSLVNGRISELAGLSSSLDRSISSLSGSQRDAAKSTIQSAIMAGRAGRSLTGLDLGGSIESLTNIDESKFSSEFELKAERARTANELKELKDLTEGQLSEAEKNALLIERQIETIKSASEREIEELNELQGIAEEEAQRRFDEEFQVLQGILDESTLQVNALLGIETGITTLADVQADLAAAIEALKEQIAANAIAVATAEAENKAQSASVEAPETENEKKNEELLTFIALKTQDNNDIFEDFNRLGMPVRVIS